MRHHSHLRTACCLLALSALAAGPQALPQFRTQVELVVVDVTVLNRAGEPLADLRAEEFTLAVDGRPRQIKSVRVVRPETPGIAAGALLDQADAFAPRRFVVVIDRQHIQVGEGQQMLEAAANFVDRLAPGDRVAVWTTPESPGTVRFSPDRESVKQQIRRSVGAYRAPMGPWMVGRDEAIRASENHRGVLAEIIARECHKQPEYCPPQVEAQVMEVAMDARHRAEAVLADVGALIDSLAPLDGPKHLVLVTEGPVLAMDGWPTIALLGERAALARVTVHALQVQDPSYRARTDQMRASPEWADQSRSAAVALASTTGGLALTPASGNVGFERLARELSVGYVLVFETESADRDGKAHEIEVKLRGAAWGTSLRARKTFRIDPSAPRAVVAAAQAGAARPAAPAEPAERAGTDPGDISRQYPAAPGAPAKAAIEACGNRHDLPCYHVILDAYAAGRRDEAVSAILKWKPRSVERRAEAFDLDGDERAPWTLGRYTTAAMLHTDAALRSDPSALGAESIAHLRTVTAILAEDSGRRSPRSARRTPDMNRAVRSLAERWYLAIARYLRDRAGALFVAVDLLTLGRDRLPKDWVVLAESGIQAESLATIFALAGQPPDDWGVRRAMKRREENLVAAVGWLREAVALEPGSEIVRVHLGRVLALRLHDDEALHVLRPVAETSPDVRLAYLALIFTGAVHERQARLEEAAASYRAAIMRLPQGHAACIGLSEVLQRLGKGDESRQVIRAMLTEAAGPTAEPLWDYTLDPLSAVDARLDALREEAGR